MHLLHRFTLIALSIVVLNSLVFAQTPRDQAVALFHEARALAFKPEEAKQRLALEKFQEAARLFRQVGATYHELASYLGAGVAANRLKQYRLAREFSLKSLPLFEGPDKKPELASMIYEIGTFSILIGERLVAIEYYTKAIALYEQLGNAKGQSDVESDLGGLYHQLGNYDQALHFLNLALPRRRKLGQSCNIAVTLTNIGVVQTSKGEWTKALDTLKHQALPLYNALPECELHGKYPSNSECPNDLAVTLLNIGKTYYDLADYKMALCFYERAEPLITFKEFKAALLNNLGTIDYKLKRYDAALERFRQARELHASVAAEALTNMGLAQSPDAKVLEMLKEALRLRREVGNANAEAVTLNSLGEVYNRLKQPQEALENFNRAVELFNKAGDRSGEATALTNTMLSWRMLGDRKSAIGSGKQAVDRFQELRVETRGAGEIERTYVRMVRQAYQVLAELMIEDGQAEQAIKVLSLYGDAQSLGPTQAGAGKTDIAQVIGAQQSLASIPALRGVALYTLAADNKLYIVAVTRNGLRVFSRAITPAVLEQKVKNFLRVLQCADLNPYPAGSELYDLIFRATLVRDRRTTLEAVLRNENAATLLWSLDRPLSSIPIAALYDSGARKFVLEKYQTAVFTRNEAELFTREPKPWLRGVGMGTSEQFTGKEPIPGAEAALAAIFGERGGVLSGKTIVNLNFNAQSLEELDGQWPLIHIMSHFVSQPGDSQGSYLVLGDGKTYTLARMREQPDLFAGVELLSIPICESAAPIADAYGKEIEAFADLAQHVGAKSVIASLWKVSYHVTPKLMLRFFELAKAHPDWPKTELLRRAQLDLLHNRIEVPSEPDITRGNCGATRRPFVTNARRRYAHPYYWSAFVLYGAPR